MTNKDTPNGVIFDGSVKHPTRVVLEVDPARSPLVRQTSDYTLEATGAVSFGGVPATAAESSGSSVANSSIANNAGNAGGGAGASASGANGGAHSGPSVVGVYNLKMANCAAKFLADGTINLSTGEHGTWECFDADTRTYVVNLSGTKYTLTFQPARGFIDSNNNLMFEQKR